MYYRIVHTHTHKYKYATESIVMQFSHIKEEELKGGREVGKECVL